MVFRWFGGNSTIAIKCFSASRPLLSQWLFDGFWVIQPSGLMVFNGHGLLVQGCHGFNWLLTSSPHKIFYCQSASAKILTKKLLTCKKRQFAAIGCWTVGFPELNASVCGGQCAFRVSGFVGGCRGEGRVYFRNLPLSERPVFFSHTRSHTVQAWQRCHAQTMDRGLGKIWMCKCPRTRTIMHTEILFGAVLALLRIISI